MAGVTVVRDGDFLGVVAPTERAAGRARERVRRRRGTCRAGQPSSDDDLRLSEERTRRRPAPAAIGHGADAAGARAFSATYRIPYIAHVPLEPRAAVAEWAWTGSSRSGPARSVRSACAPSWPRRSTCPEARVRVDRAGHGFRVRRQAHGRSGDRGRAPREGGEAAREAGLDARGRIPVGLLPSRRRHRRQRGCRCERHGSSPGSSTTGTPAAPACARRMTSRIKTQAFHPTKIAAAPGLVSRLAATANHYAREMHMDEMARALGVDAVEFRLQHLERRPPARRADGRRGADRLAESFGAGPRPRDRVRNREGRLRRHRRRSLARGGRLHRRAPRRSPSSAARSSIPMA